jgi:3-oxoacyl-(acyl-carrier-protein) synthase
LNYRFLISTTRRATGEVVQLVGTCRTFAEAVHEAEDIAANAVGGLRVVIVDCFLVPTEGDDRVVWRST